MKNHEECGGKVVRNVVPVQKFTLRYVSKQLNLHQSCWERLKICINPSHYVFEKVNFASQRVFLFPLVLKALVITASAIIYLLNTPLHS
jgi:hypothetical protein